MWASDQTPQILSLWLSFTLTSSFFPSPKTEISSIKHDHIIYQIWLKNTEFKFIIPMLIWQNWILLFRFSEFMFSYWICYNLIKSQACSYDSLEIWWMQPSPLSCLWSPANGKKKNKQWYHCRERQIMVWYCWYA